MNTSSFPVVLGVEDKQPFAVKYAIEEARKLHRPLRAVHCAGIPALNSEYFVSSQTLANFQAEGELVLNEVRDLVEMLRPSLEVDYLAANGSPIAVLEQEALHAAVLILGSDEVPWFERLLGGAVSGYLARKAPCPVVVVPERSVPGAGAGGVVVTVDGDTSAAGPLRYAFEQADLRHEPLHVLHAAPKSTTRADFEAHRANVSEVLAGWQELFPDVMIFSATTAGEPAEASIAATTEASLVVIGRPHGHATPFARARPIAMTVLRRAQCPVAVIPVDYGQV